ncbi:chondroitin sulfate proteoglycan 5b isoform X2 [Stigmatopora nigra]
MASGGGPSWTRRVLLAVSVLLIAATATHGRHSMSRRHHHRDQSSPDRETGNPGMGLSEDSAERDHLIEAGHPLFSKRHHSHKRTHPVPVPDPVPDPAGEELTAGGAGADQKAASDEEAAAGVEFHRPAPEMSPADLPRAQKQKGGDPTAWTLSDFYDYLSPDDDLSASAPAQDPEPSLSPPADMEDENPLLSGAAAVAPVGAAAPPAPAENKPVSPAVDDDGDGLSLGGGAMGSDGCRLGFVRSGPGICVSRCDLQPDFCFNDGVCTVVAGVGAFCRCNVQDYIWNKGTRCDWAVTEFQVMSALVGVASVALLVVFMIVVFFAKRLHRLKKDNRRLRKRSKYRPQSGEPQTDGLSVSTTADGSQPNDDPQKQEEPAKSPPGKEEGAMNILNSHSPKHENNRPNSAVRDNADDNAEDGVTIGLEVLLPKDVKLRPEKTPPLQYDVFLYKVGNNGEPPVVSNSQQQAAKASKNTKSPKRKHDRHQSLSGRHSSPFLHPSPGGCPAPTHHPSGRPWPRARPSSSYYPGAECEPWRLRASPSSPHLTQSSPSRKKCSPVSTRSLPPLSRSPQNGGH